jgi:phosphonate transport system substrate-binding protein
MEKTMHHRRTLLAASVALLVSTLFANAEDWKAKYPELTFAVVPSENATGVIERYTPYMGYLSRQLGVKVNLRVASDYAAVIEGQRSGNIHIASYGSAAFARALITGVKTEAFALEQNIDGTTGYYSVFYVLANSPYKTIADVKGKSLGLVDPNSTSGNNVPRLMLDKQGIDPEAYFGKVIFTGSHENAVVALVQGTIHVAANSWNAPNDSTLTRMIRKGMLKNADGSSMKYEDFRIIATSDPILNGPLAYLSDLPTDLKLAIEDAYFGARTNDPEAFGKLSDGKMARDGWTPARTEQWQPVVDLVKFVDGLRRKRS